MAMGIRRPFFPFDDDDDDDHSCTSPSARGPLSAFAFRPYCVTGPCATSHAPANKIEIPRVTAHTPLRYNQK